MKKLILTAFLIFFVSSLQLAQIPNAGFEDWTNGDPTGWSTLDILGDAVSKSSDSHSGSSAARLEIINFMGLPIPPLLTTICQVSQRHGSLKGYYKFTPQSSTQVFIVGVLAFANSEPIGGGGWEEIAAVSSYTEFNAPIEYVEGAVPDSIFIEFAVIDTLEGSTSTGSYAIIDDLSFGAPTDVELIDLVSPTYFLKQNYPNPFNPSTTIEFSIPEESFVELKVYNILGKEVSTLAYNTYLPGSYRVEFNARDLSSGIYLAKLNATAKAGNFNFSKSLKMTLIK